MFSRLKLARWVSPPLPTDRFRPRDADFLEFFSGRRALAYRSRPLALRGPAWIFWCSSRLEAQRPLEVEVRFRDENDSPFALSHALALRCRLGAGSEVKDKSFGRTPAEVEACHFRARDEESKPDTATRVRPIQCELT